MVRDGKAPVMVRSHRESAARREGVSNHDPSSRSSLLTTNGIEETTSARAMQGEGRNVWFETTGLDLRSRSSLLTTNGFGTMQIKWLPFVVSPSTVLRTGLSNHERLSPPPFVVSLSNHERNEAQLSPLPYALSGTPAGVGDKQNADSRFPLPVSLATFQPSEANHSSSDPSLTPSKRNVER